MHDGGARSLIDFLTGCYVLLNTERKLIQPLGEPALFPALHLYGQMVRSAYRRRCVLSVVPSVDRNVDLGVHRDGGPGDFIGPPPAFGSPVPAEAPEVLRIILLGLTECLCWPMSHTEMAAPLGHS